MADNQGQQYKPTGNPMWVKGGPSPNPSGRTPRKPLTQALTKALAQPWKRGSDEKLLDLIIRRLAEIIAKGEERHVIKSIELIWKYLEGNPAQSAEIDFQKALDEAAARTGAPRLWLMRRAEEITRRHMLGPGSDQQADDRRVMGVRR